MNHHSLQKGPLDTNWLNGASGVSQSISSLAEDNDDALHRFLTMVANSTLKVKILQVFLSNPGICLSSPSLAERVRVSVIETRVAAQQLDEAGALNYCPHFAFADLCHLSLPRLPQPMQLQLGLLSMALRQNPQRVWCHFEDEDEENTFPGAKPQIMESQGVDSNASIRPATLRAGVAASRPDR